MELNELAKKVLADIKKRLSVEELMNKYNLTETELQGVIQYLEIEGNEFNFTTNNDGTKSITKKNGYHKERILKPSIDELDHVKLAIVSDTHMGNKLQQLTLINKFYKEAHNRGITTVLHCGDVVDGDYRNKRPAHPYDLFAQGASEQWHNVTDTYPCIEGMTTYFITGSHDQTHYLNGGFDIGEAINRERPDMVYLGPNQAYFYAADGRLPIYIRHPGGGCSKSYSYKPQESLNKIEFTEKPKIMLVGHYHKSYLMYYNDVYTLLVPCLVDQTQFMKMNDLQNVVGGVFLDLYIDKKGNIEYFNYDEVRYTDKDVIVDDYKTAKRLVIK